jgi:Flp pilus assembly protein TadD
MVKYTSVMALLLLTACGETSGDAAQAKNLPTSQESNLVRLGNSTRAAGDLNAAEKLYRDAIRQSKGSTPEPYLALANLYQSQGQTIKALNTLKEGITLQEESLALPLANMLISNGSHLEALKYARLATKHTQDNPRAFNTLGVALDNTGNYEQAQKSYETALRLSPSDSGYIQNNLALSYIMSDDFSDAIGILKPIAESTDSTATIRQNLALAYSLKGEESAAKAWMLKDLPEDKASENLAFYKHYSKQRLVSSRTTSDTAVEPVAVSELDIPKELLSSSAPKTPAEHIAMVPILKPTRLVKNNVPAVKDKLASTLTKAPAKDTTAIQQAAKITPTAKHEPVKQSLAKASPAMPMKDEFDEDYVDDTIIASKPKALMNIEPAAGDALSVKSSIIVKEVGLPAPAFKPAR